LRGTDATDSADATLGTVGGRPAPAALPRVERTGGALSPVRRAEGGDAWVAL